MVLHPLFHYIFGKDHRYSFLWTQRMARSWARVAGGISFEQATAERQALCAQGCLDFKIDSEAL